MLRGSVREKTPGSKSKALLCSVTRLDQRLTFCFAIFPSFPLDASIRKCGTSLVQTQDFHPQAGEWTLPTKIRLGTTEGSDQYLILNSEFRSEKTARTGRPLPLG